MLRNSFEDYVIRSEPGKKITDVGGNYARHAAKHKDADIHTCAPITCPEDIIREVTRTYCDIKPCRARFGQCTHPYDVLLFNHSLYYIRQDEFCTVPAGKVIYASHHIYRKPGVYMAGEQQVTGTPDDWIVVTRGNGTPYRHPECWLKGEAVIPGYNCVIAFKLICTHDSLHTFKGVAFSLPIWDTYYLEPRYAPPPPLTILWKSSWYKR